MGRVILIDSFTGTNRFLSNFFQDPVSGTSVEALFQAAKSIKAPERRAIALMSPRDAKVAGRAVNLRTDWEAVKVSVMADLVRLKFTSSEEHGFFAESYAKSLVQTFPARLIEGNTWHDNFWGNCTCGRPACRPPGANVLGTILMTTRSWLL